MWLKDGKVYEQGAGIDRLPFLLDMGALDSFDKLKAGQVEWVVLSEDSSFVPIRLLLEASGFDVQQTLLFSYKTSSNIESAIILASFIHEIAPNTKIVIHRDRDFMTNEEAERMRNKIRECGALPFITRGSDIESYFVENAHLAELLQQTESDVETWLSSLARVQHNQLSHTFTRKRDEIKWMFYKKGKNECPVTIQLLGSAVPLAADKRLGKAMLKLVRTHMNGQYHSCIDPVQRSNALTCPELKAILDSEE